MELKKVGDHCSVMCDVAVPSVSVVMPVHNTGAYLKDTISSLQYQMFKDFELICVDDASDDEETLELLREFEKNVREFPVKVIYLEHGVGAAEARNVGFREVKGEYTIFLDSDDVFAPAFLKKMFETIQREASDICICGDTSFRDRDGKRCYSVPRILDKETISRRTEENWLLSVPGVPWDKLCRTEYLKNNNIVFQPISSCNDVYFSVESVKCTDKISVIEDADMISYRLGIPHQISACRNSLNAFNAIEPLIRRYKNDHLFLTQCSLYLLALMIQEIPRCREERRNRELYECIKNHFRRTDIRFSDSLFEEYRNCILSLPYESNWFRMLKGFEWKLWKERNRIKELLAPYNSAMLWGMGKRGKAFEWLCRYADIELAGVTDIKEENRGNLTENGYLILTTDEVLQKADVIIASNNSVKDYLLALEVANKIVNLNEYC